MPIDFVTDKLSLSWVVLFLLFVIFPGLVSMRVFRLMAPAKEIDWKNASYESAFLGTINFLVGIIVITLLYAIISPFNKSFFESYDLLGGIIHTFAILVILSVLLPYSWLKMREWGCLNRFLLAHHPSAWDFYFSEKRPCFVLVHLKKPGGPGDYSSGAPTDPYVQTLPHTVPRNSGSTRRLSSISSISE